MADGYGTTDTPGQATSAESPLGKLILEDIRSTAAARATLKRKIEVRKKMVSNELPNRHYFNGRSNVVIPFPHTYVQSMLPRYMRATFPGHSIVEFIPLGIAYNRAQLQSRLVNFSLFYEMDFYMKAYQSYSSLLEYGAFVNKVRWDNKKQTCEIVYIKPDTFCFDTKSAPWICQQTKWAAYEMGRTREELQEFAKDPNRNVDMEVLKEILDLQPKETDQNGTMLGTVRGEFYLWEWHGECDPGPSNRMGPDGVTPQTVTGKRKIVAWMANDKVLGWMDSPYNELPFIALSELPDVINWYNSRSELDPIQSPFEAASDIVNQRMDNVTMSINGRWTYLKHSGLNLSELVSSPWGIMGVNRHEDLQYWESPNVTQDAYREVQEMSEVMKFSTGLIDLLRGESSPGEKTGQEIQKTGMEAGARPDLKIQMAMHTYVGRIGQLTLDQFQSFMSAEKAVSIVGDPMAAQEVLVPEAIQGASRCTPVASSMVGNKQARAAELINGMQVLQGKMGFEQQLSDVVNEWLSLLNVKSRPMSTQQLEAIALQRMERMNSAVSAAQGDSKGAAGTGNKPGISSMKNTPPAGALDTSPKS